MRGRRWEGEEGARKRGRKVSWLLHGKGKGVKGNKRTGNFKTLRGKFYGGKFFNKYIYVVGEGEGGGLFLSLSFSLFSGFTLKKNFLN